MSAAAIDDLVARWSAAERAHDAVTLGALLDDDFRGIGPLGFVLDRAAWLRRFDDGLRYSRAEMGEVEVREHGTLAVAVGVWDQVAEYRGHPNPGRFRTGLVARRSDGASAPGARWTLLGIQLSGPMPDAM